MTLRFVLALVSAAITLTACNVVETSGGPLNEEECGQLMDKFHEVLSVGLEGEELAAWDADRDRAADVAECVEDQNWDRKGFECAMEQTTHGGLNRCILASR